MKSLLIKNCGQLLTMKGDALGLIAGGYVLCEDGLIVKVGKGRLPKADQVIDAEGKVVMPGLIDCHTHLIFAGSRENEFEMKLKGKSYLEILQSGGGIHSTVKATRQAFKNELLVKAFGHLKDMLHYGITTVEIKSGYGLDLETEIKILDVATELAKKQPIKVVKTFLGAHSCPREKKTKQYLKFVIDEVLPKISADFVDIFCEKGVFSVRQARKFLKKAKEMGFKIKIHAEQLHRLGAARMGAKLGAISCDHLDHLSKRDIKVLAKNNSVAVLLPIVPLYTRENVYADGRALVDGGVKVAVATDFNPGSAPVKNIFLAMTLACLKMGLSITDVLRAVTVNAAAALDLQHEAGSLVPGKRADIVITKVHDYKEIPYWFADNPVEKVVIGGKLVYKG